MAFSDFGEPVVPDAPFNDFGELIQAGPVASKKPSSIAGDIGHGLKIGADVAALDVRELVGRVPGIGKAIVSALDKVDEWVHKGVSSEPLLKADIEAQTAAMSPEQQAAGQKRWDTLGPDSAWRDWRSYTGGLAQSIPEEVVMMVPALRLAKGAAAASMARSIAVDAEAGLAGTLAHKAAQKAAGEAAAKTATIAGSAIEGSLGGAQSSRQVRDEILALSEADLKDSDALKALTDSGLTFEKAKAQLADDASTKAFVLAGVATAAFGGLGDRVLVKAMTGGLAGGILSRAAKGAVAEGVLEELPQSALQQVAQNVAMQAAVPSTALSKDVATQAFGGLAIGALQGGVQTAVLGRGAPSPKQPILDAPDVDSAITAFKFATASPIDREAILAPYRAGFKDQASEVTAEHQALLVQAFENDPTFAPDVEGRPTVNRAQLRVVAPQALPTEGEGLTRDAYEAIAALNKASGLQTVIYADDPKLPDGLVNAATAPEFAFISDKASIDPAVVASHEAQHLLDADSTKFEDYSRIVGEELTADATAVATKRHGELATPKLQNEIRADIAGDAWADPAFHARVLDKMVEQLGEKKTETTATTFLDSIKELITRVKAVLTGTTFTTPDGKRLATQYVTNLERVHDALAVAIADKFISEGYRPPGAQTNASQLLVNRAMEMQREKAEAALVSPADRTAIQNIRLKAPPITAPEGASPQLVSALEAAQKAPFDRTTTERLNLEAVQIGVQMSPKSIAPTNIQNDDGDVAQAKAAFFGKDDESHVRYAADLRGNIRLLGVFSGNEVRGRDMVQWLKQAYGRPVVVDEVANDAVGFWEKMKSENLIKSWSDKPFAGKTTALPEPGVQMSPKIGDLSASPRVIVRESLLKKQTPADKQAGYAIALNNPIHLADGSRLSGFSDPVTRTTFYGYDKNGEKFTVRATALDPATITGSRDGNRTADSVRESVSALQPVGKASPKQIVKIDDLHPEVQGDIKAIVAEHPAFVKAFEAQEGRTPDAEDAGANLFGLVDAPTVRQLKLVPSSITNTTRQTSPVAVAEYKAMLKPQKAPAILVKQVGSGYAVVEGGHRLKAAQEAKATSIEAIDVTQLLATDWAAYLTNAPGTGIQASPKSDAAHVRATTEGVHVNIGLNIGDKVNAVSHKAAETALRLAGVKILKKTYLPAGKSEPTLVVTLDRALTPVQAMTVSRALGQQAISQLGNGEGTSYGPQADEWKFSPEYFQMHNGRTMQEMLPPPAPPAAKDKRTGVVLTKQMRMTTSAEFKYGDRLPFTVKDQVELGELLQEMSTTYTTARTEDTPQNREFGARVIEHEVRLALQSGSRNAIGWYDHLVADTRRTAALIHPELATDDNAWLAFTYALAVTSNGHTIKRNVENAFEVYEKRVAKTHHLPVVGYGLAHESMESAFQRWNTHVRLDGIDKYRNFLLSKHTVRDLREFNPNMKELQDDIVYGGTVIGSKIGGGFLQNIHRNFDALTMDRWFMRTWGRITGKLVDEQVVRKLIPGTKGKFSANREMALIDDPRTGSNRHYIRATIQMALERLQKDNPALTTADLQAILWYEEKDLYTMHGVNTEEPTDYAIETAKYVQSRGIDQAAIDNARNESGQPAGREADNQRRVDEPTHPDVAATSESRAGGAGINGERVGPVTQQSPKQGRLDLVGVHFSLQPRDVLRGWYFGTGMKGAEVERVMSAPDERLRTRIYAYVNTGNGVFPEKYVGGQAHTLPLANLYDANSDPLNLFRGHGDNATESMILDAGFAGYLARSDRQGVAVLMGPAAERVVAEHKGVGYRGVDLPVAPAAVLTPNEQLARDISRDKRLPGGEMSGAEWKADLPRLAPELYAKLDAKGIISRIEDRVRYYRSDIGKLVRAENNLRVVAMSPKVLFAPNGKRSKLEPRLHKMVRTPAFKKWFGDWEKFANLPGGVWNDDRRAVSKVVDDNSEPLVVYHGTQTGGFTKFSQDSSQKERASFFTDDPRTAWTYSGTVNEIDLSELDEEGNAPEQSGVYPVFLNIRDPNETDFEGANWDGQRDNVNSWVVRGADNDNIYLPDGTGYFSREEADALVEQNPGSEAIHEEMHYETTDSVVSEAIRYKNDGAIIHNVIDSGLMGDSDLATIYAVLSPNQIKSIENSGKFSRADNSILASPKQIERAKALGFNTKRTWYRYDTEDYNHIMGNKYGLHLGAIHFASTPAGANQRFETIKKNQPQTGGFIGQYWLKANNPLQLRDLGTWTPGSVVRQVRSQYMNTPWIDSFLHKAEPLAEAWENSRDSPEDDDNPDIDDVKRQPANDAIWAALKAAGFDGIKYRNTFEGGTGIMVPDPSQVRSINAKFEEGTTGDVMASPKTPEFEKWFGDSKVVDARGEPLVVYHGTYDDFSQFNVGEEGAFFSTAKIASRYAGFAVPEGGNVIPAYLSLKNPLIVNDPGGWKIGANYYDRTRGDLQKQARDGGHDGIIIRSRKGRQDESMYIAFRLEQIKSIFNERPTSSANISLSPKTIGDSKRPYTAAQRQMFQNVGRTVDVPTVGNMLANLRKDLGKKLTQGLVDQFAPLKELSPIAYLLARLSKGAAGSLEALLKHGKVSIRGGAYDGDRTGGFIDQVLIPLQGEAHDWLWWMAAHRAEYLTADDREHLFLKQDILAGKTLSDGNLAADYVLSNGQVTRNRLEAFSDSARKYDAFNKNVLDMAEQSGLFNPGDRATWEKMMYVPFFRVSEDGGFVGGKVSAKLVGQHPFHRLKGGTEKLNSNLLENVLSNWYHLLDAGIKNRAAKESLEAAAAIGAATESNEATVKEMARASGKKSSAVWFLDQGVKRHFVVGDPFVLTAITSLQYSGMHGPIMDAMSTFKHVLTVGVTASPTFKIRNLIRDSLQAVATSEIGYNPITNIRQGIAASEHSTQTYVSALASGGLIRFGTMLEGRASAQVDQLVRLGVKKSTILNTDSNIRQAYDLFDKGLTAYNELGNRSEEITRAALYKQLIDKGVDHAQAALMARDLMDFSLQGSYTAVRFLTQVVPFMNARMQGLYKLGRAANEDPKRFAAVLAATALFSIALMAAYSDDDDWKKREDFDRDNFWWFKIGGVALRIPKPFEVGAIATLAERGIEYFTSPEMTGERLTARTLSLISNNLSMNPIPQLVKPLWDISTNKNSFTGRPIETMGMEKLQPDYRFTSRTSMAARAASTTGQTVAGAVGLNFLSPVQIDSMLQGYFGWLGSFIVGASEELVRPLTNEPARPSRDLWKFATQGMVTEVPANQSRYVSHMYEQAQIIEQAYGTYRELLKTGRREEAQTFLADNRDKLAKYRHVEAIKRAESQINEAIRIIERSAKTPDEKKALIAIRNAQKDRIARQIR